VNLRAELEEAIARIVFAREALELGEPGIVATALRDLEEDLAAALECETGEVSS
jgi:hypothetical protein